MIPPNDILINPLNVFKKFKELIDKYREEIETKDTFYYKNLLEEIRNTSFWNLYSLSYNVCMHIYKNGKRQGQVCGAKIFINTDNKLQKYLCSRHCRDYISKNRVYTKDNIRCSYKRNNGNICKHKCEKNKNYCYIHKEKSEHIKLLEIAHPNFNDSNMYKNFFLEKLEKKRKIYFLRKYNKYRNINNNAKYIKNLKFSKIPKFYNFSKIFNIYNDDYINYNYYNKTKYKTINMS